MVFDLIGNKLKQTCITLGSSCLSSGVLATEVKKFAMGFCQAGVGRAQTGFPPMLLSFFPAAQNS